MKGRVLKGRQSSLPGEAYFLAHTRLLVAADFLRDDTVGLEVTTQVLRDHQHSLDMVTRENTLVSAYSFCPVNRNVGAVNVCRRLVLQVFKTRVARFLGEAGLIAEVEEPTDAILTGLEVQVLNKSEAINSSQRSEQKMGSKGSYPLQRPESRSTIALQRSILPKRAA